MKYNNQGTLSTGSSRSSSEDRKMNRTDIVDDDRCSSSESYGPQDTKTPYIMRLIEAKSVGNRSRQPPSTEVGLNVLYKDIYLVPLIYLIANTMSAIFRFYQNSEAHMRVGSMWITEERLPITIQGLSSVEYPTAAPEPESV